MFPYSSSDELYSVLKTLFERIKIEAPGAAQAVIDTKMSYRLVFTDPEAELFIDGKRNPLAITYGENSSRPNLDVALPTSMFHQIMLGELSLKKAFTSGQLKVRGPFWKSTALGELFKQGQQIYQDILSSQGLTA